MLRMFVSRRGLGMVGAVMAMVATLVTIMPAAASASSGGFACVASGGDVTVNAPGQTTFNVQRNGKWIVQVTGAQLDDASADYSDPDYTAGDSYAAIVWIKGVRNVVPCESSTGNPPPPPLDVVCTIDSGAITVKSGANSFNLRKNGAWIASVTSDLSDMKVDFVDQSFQAGDSYEVIVRQGGARSDATCTDSTPVPTEDPSIDLTKFVNGWDANSAPGPEFDDGSGGKFGYRVVNTGDVTLTNVMVTDDTLGAITCDRATLAPGERVFCTAVKTLNGPAQVFMEAEVKGTSPAGLVVRDNDPVNFTVGSPVVAEVPGISLIKKVNGQDANTAPGPIFEDGSRLRFTYEVHNTGNVDLANVELVDDTLGVISCAQNTLAVGESITCNADKTAARAERVFMEAEVTGTSPAGTVVRDDDPVNFSVVGKSCFFNGEVVPDGGSVNDGHRSYICTNGGLRVWKSPIGLDVDSSGFVERIDAVVQFDFDGDGETSTVGEWFAPSEGILIDTLIPGPVSGLHLFGDQSGLFTDGFEKLSLRDTNGDAFVSGVELAGLAVWIDVNSNGVLDIGEQTSLASHGVVSLSTSHTNFLSEAVLADGSVMVVEDVWFPVDPRGQSATSLLLAGIGLLTLFGWGLFRRSRREDLDAELAAVTSPELTRS